jgi:uracil-DNA glycosylase family 4
VQKNMNRQEAVAVLEWLIEMGADEVVGDEPINRFIQRPEALSTGPPERSSRLEHVPAKPTHFADKNMLQHLESAPDLSSRRMPGPTPQRDDSRRSGPGRTMGPGLRRDDAIGGGRDHAIAGGNAVDDAKSIAAACHSLDDVIAALSRFDACPLKRTATNLALCDGNPEAHVMCVGEAPGRDEDLQGKPFVGRSGQLLDRMLEEIGLKRDAPDPARSVFITNVIFWRPPGNRTPTEQETLMCLPFLRRTIEVLRPRFILCLGATPTQRLTGRTDGILKLRGKWFDFDLGGGKVPLLATLHPAYLLRQPSNKRLAWRDLLALRKALDDFSGGPETLT